MKESTGVLALEEILKEQTQELRTQYIAKVQEWATNDFAIQTKRNEWTQEKWREVYPQRRNVTKTVDGQRVIVTHVTISYEGLKDKEKAYRITRKGLEKYLQEETESAERHYTNSIYKLAKRISEKGLNKDSLTVTTSAIKQNIETIITDGTITVRAFTVLAWGDIIRPHYRYLIK